MTTAPDDWEALRNSWESAEPTAGGPEALALVRRARRGEAFAALAELVLVLVAIGGIALALRHAADTLELTLGVSAGAAIVGAWALGAITRSREAKAVASSASDYASALRRLRTRQLRVVHSTWVVLALELAFLAPWWAGGIGPHRGRLGDPVALASLWLPLAAMLGLAAWSARFRRRLVAELRRLEGFQREMAQERDGG